MRISYNWLKEICPLDMSTSELCEKLSGIGLCVDTYEPIGDDWSIDVEVTSNRPDCLSMFGIAREVAALTGEQVKHPDVQVTETGAPVDESAAMQVLDEDLCPHYTARVIRDIEIKPSPEWMQKRLLVCGLRPVNNVVDITNYVMLETGQPLHAFDLAKLRGPEIRVRRGREGEEMTAIDGTVCKLTPAMCLIADAEQPVAIAGVMGGLDSEIGGSTEHVLLEAARFDPAATRRTARALGLNSDSSYRFERGVDPEGVRAASRRAAQLICELAGGNLAPGLLEARSDETERAEVAMRFGRLGLVLGIEVPRERVLQIFRSLELEIADEGEEAVTVRVPSFRPDLEREVDLIEEVARFYGYDKISETTRISVRPVRRTKQERATEAAREFFVASGFYEILTSSLVGNDPLQRVNFWGDAAGLALRTYASKEKTHLRTSLLPNLLIAKHFNQARGNRRINLFELSKVYLPELGRQLPTEKLCLSALSDEDESFLVLKGMVEALSERMGLSHLITQRPLDEEVPLLEGEAAVEILLENKRVGVLGMVSEEWAEKLDLLNRPSLLELDFDRLMAGADFERRYAPVPQFPPIERDLAVLVDEDLHWAQIEECIRQHGPEWLTEISFFDIYRGKQIPAGKKSVAFSMTFRAPDRTLRSEEADEVQATILEGLEEKLGAQLR